MPFPRRFPPPWSIEEGAALLYGAGCDKQALAQAGVGVCLFRERARAAIERKAAHALAGIPYRGEHRLAAERAAAAPKVASASVRNRGG
jgi:hypothetical protein